MTSNLEEEEMMASNASRAARKSAATEAQPSALIFEPHGGYGSMDPDGEPWPYGYISEDTGAHRVPIFALTVILERTDAELEALARKFAAAPAMYEALKGYHEAVAAYMLTPAAKRTFHHEQRLKAAAAIARAAIAAAEGRS